MQTKFLWNMVRLHVLWGSKQNEGVGEKYQEASQKRVILTIALASEIIFRGFKKQFI